MWVSQQNRGEGGDVPCSVVIQSVNGVVAAGQVDPAVIRVTGQAVQCAAVLVTSSATAGSGSVPVDGNGRWWVDLPVTAAGLHCGDHVTVDAACDGIPACKSPTWNNQPLACCEIPVLFFQASSGGTLQPTGIDVAGTIRGCAGDQVTVSAEDAGGAPLSAPMTVISDPATGAFRATLPVAGVNCDDDIKVTAQCASQAGCVASVRDKLECPDCYRAAVSYTSKPCQGNPPTQEITLKAMIGLPTGPVTRYFEWVFGDGTTSAQFPITNPAGSPSSATHAAPDTPHNYAPGAWTARLRAIPPPGECPETPLSFTVQCPPGGDCPTIVPDPPVVSATCVNGQRAVTLNAKVTVAAGGQAAVAQWHFGDPMNTLGTAQPVPPGTQLDITEHPNYPAPASGAPPTTYQAFLRVVWPTGCPDVTVPVVIAPCTTMTPPCDLTAPTALVSYGACNPDGTRTVTVTATEPTAQPNDLCYWTWDSNPATQGTRVADGGLTGTHNYPAARSNQTISYSATLTIIRGPNCLTSNAFAIDVQPCVGTTCPQLTGISVTAGDCSTDGRTRAMTLTAQTNGGPAESYDWDFGDGSPVQTTTSPSSPAHAFAAGSSPTVSVTAHMTGCADSGPVTQMISVPACPPPTNTTPDTPTDPRVSWCPGLLWASIILAAIGAAVAIAGCIISHYFFYVGLAIGIIGGVLFTIGLILFVIWWIVCRLVTPCQVLLTAIDVVSALIAVFAVVAIVLGILAIFGFEVGCFIEALATFGYWGAVLAMLVWLARDRKCLVSNPGGGQGTGSSSSSLTDPANLARSGAATSLRRSDPFAFAAAATPATAAPQGVGDLVKNGLARLGVPACAECHARAARLNELFPLRDAPGDEEAA